MNHFSESNTAVVVPFFNERRFLAELIYRIPENLAKIILVDDGSTDGSASLIPNNNHRIILLSHPFNAGKGAALKTGFKKSIEMGFSATVTIDADLQHPPEIIPTLISLLNVYEVVLGTRVFDPEKMPFTRVLSNLITSKIISIKAGTRIKDSQSGYRAFRNDILQKIFPASDDFIAESEMVIKAGLQGISIGECPIPVIYGDETSKIRNHKVISGFIKKIIFRRKFN